MKIRRVEFQVSLEKTFAEASFEEIYVIPNIKTVSGVLFTSSLVEFRNNQHIKEGSGCNSTTTRTVKPLLYQRKLLPRTRGGEW